jgi:pyruvate dehydrogenase E2 component (dihydrolipoamide acetyltransferase)
VELETAIADERVPLSRMRRAIVATMSLSAQIPQFTLDRTVDLTQLVARRSELAARGTPVSVTDVLTAACARALRAHPALNASFDEDAIVIHGRVNVGLAVAVPGGLVSPAIFDADRLTLAELAAERQRLRDGAVAGKLRGEVLFGATFTISNLGTYGIDRFRALVIPPQTAILAVGALRQHDGAPVMSLSLSCDHRVIDGAPAAEFLGTIAEALEQPAWINDPTSPIT